MKNIDNYKSNKEARNKILKESSEFVADEMRKLQEQDDEKKREEGIKEGESLGENRINQLILKLSELNRTDEILKAAADREYQKKLLKELGL